MHHPLVEQLRRDMAWYAFARGPDGEFVVSMLQGYADMPELWQAARAHASAVATQAGADPHGVTWVPVTLLSADQQLAVTSYWHGYIGLPPEHRR